MWTACLHRHKTSLSLRIALPRRPLKLVHGLRAGCPGSVPIRRRALRDSIAAADRWRERLQIPAAMFVARVDIDVILFRDIIGNFRQVGLGIHRACAPIEDDRQFLAQRTRLPVTPMSLVAVLQTITRELREAAEIHVLHLHVRSSGTSTERPLLRSSVISSARRCRPESPLHWPAARRSLPAARRSSANPATTKIR